MPLLRNGIINSENPLIFGMTAKICIVIKSFENQRLGHLHNTRKIGLPKKQILYTVLRSPHIDKKSREQFEMRIHKELLVIETETQKLREKLHWLKLRATRRT